jgi:hypothetical protein
MHQDLSTCSRQQNSQTQPDVPDSTSRSWADGDTVAREHRVGESASPDLGRRKRVLRKELRGTEVREAVMTPVVIAAAAVFVFGIVLGVIAVVAVAVRREDRRYTLAVEAPDRMSRNTRRLTGLARRDLDAEFLRPVVGVN